jgi:tetratricopeptide (TPR) repeat protein
MNHAAPASRVKSALAIAVLILAAGCAHAPQSPAVARNTEHEHAGHSLGHVDFPVSCSPAAKAEFNRAAAILHHMTYPQARQAFEHVAEIDPQCAMAHWGIAMTLFQPLWPTRPNEDARQRGWDEVQRAKAIGAPTECERLFIEAAEEFFRDPASADYWGRIQRWEAASKRAYDALPDDPETEVFYALAHLATTPATKISREHADAAAEILLRVYRQNPEHPGAMHYLVHANDVPGRERELLEITHKYESLAPRNPHALHMPTHIYTRLGDWDGVIRGNLLAAEAALEHPAGAHGEFVWDEFPHAIEYLIYAELQKGEDAAAAAQLKRLHETSSIEPTFKTAFHLASTQSRYALERQAWAEAAMLSPREPATLDWDRFTWPEAIVVFARGLGAAHVGDLEKSRTAAARLAELESATRTSGEELFARNVGVLRTELSAWIAHAEGKSESSRALMQEAIALETTTPKAPVTPAPTLPAYELLGDLLLEQRQPAAALVAYTQSLERYPRRLNTLLGAARAARDSGDRKAARAFYQQLLEVAKDGQRTMAIGEAHSFLK